MSNTTPAAPEAPGGVQVSATGMFIATWRFVLVTVSGAMIWRLPP